MVQPVIRTPALSIVSGFLDDEETRSLRGLNIVGRLSKPPHDTTA
jgi:hypothetical protein